MPGISQSQLDHQLTITSSSPSTYNLQVMLPEKHREDLVGAGIGFMQTIADIYGPEKGMELWSTIADTIDSDLKGEVFMAMLSGNYRRDKINVKNPFVSKRYG